MDTAMRDELVTWVGGLCACSGEPPRAVSMVIGPTGKPVSEILSDREGLLYASINTRACVEPSSSTTSSATTTASTCSI